MHLVPAALDVTPPALALWRQAVGTSPNGTTITTDFNLASSTAAKYDFPVDASGHSLFADLSELVLTATSPTGASFIMTSFTFEYLNAP
jgi:hypothetical protein